MHRLIELLILCVCVAVLDAAQPKCEVCLSVFDKLKEQINEKKIKGKQDQIADLIESFCSKKMGPKDTKICYNLLPMKGDAARQLSIGKDSIKVCEKLSKSNPDFCTIRYPVKTDANTDYSKLRVKQLKNILSDRGTNCPNCVEKSEYVKRCKETEHMEL